MFYFKINNLIKKNGWQHLIKFMLKFELVQTDKHSTKICFGLKIGDFSAAQIL